MSNEVITVNKNYAEVMHDIVGDLAQKCLDTRESFILCISGQTKVEVFNNNEQFAYKVLQGSNKAEAEQFIQKII